MDVDADSELVVAIEFDELMNEATVAAGSELLISGGIIGDTIFWISEGIAESELGARVGTFGGV